MSDHMTINVEIEPLIADITALEREQVPFAASRTVNALAILVQSAIRDGLRERFTIRQDYALRFGIKIPRFATKTDSPMVTQVLIPAEFDYLWKFQTGEVKVPRGGAQNLAITSSSEFPLRYAPQGKRPKNLDLGDDGKGIDRTFVIESGATPGIYQRTGPKKRDIKLLFHFA